MTVCEHLCPFYLHRWQHCQAAFYPGHESKSQCSQAFSAAVQAGVLGSSLLAMVPPSCVGLAQHARLGNVDWRMAAGLAAGTAVGSFAGSKVAVDAPAGQLPFSTCYEC